MRMLWSDRPRSAGSADAAGALVRQHDEDAVLFSTAAAPSSPQLASSGAALCELHFAVRYRLWEYASFMWQHGRHLIRRRRVGFPAAWYLLVKSTATALLHFILLRRSRRTYEFTVDEHGIVRSSGTGVTLIGWADVTAVREYSRGPMLVLKRGTLPIPSRCLKQGQLAALMRLVDARRAVPAAEA
ncbi:MAG: YcxB family protein [Telluria sp.]